MSWSLYETARGMDLSNPSCRNTERREHGVIDTAQVGTRVDQSKT